MDNWSQRSFELNRHGHIVVPAIGIGLSGKSEILLLQDAGFDITLFAKSCLASDEYDAAHRLLRGRSYRIVLLPNREVMAGHEEDPTSRQIEQHAESLSYRKPLAGIASFVRRYISDKQMEEMGFWHIDILHEPLPDHKGGRSVLFSRRYSAGDVLDARVNTPERTWDRHGASAFIEG